MKNETMISLGFSFINDNLHELALVTIFDHKSSHIKIKPYNFG